MKQSLFTLMLAALMASQLASAQTARVYKWVDEDGVTHFSAEPPAERDKATLMEVDDSAPELPVEEPESLLDSEGLEAQAAPPDNSLIEAENRRRLCAHGRRVKEMIEPLPRVFHEVDGERVQMTDDERLRLLAEAEREIETYCD